MKLNRRGVLFVLSSPSGAGKSSIAKYVLNKDENIGLSISYTTRKKRNDEVKGKDYNYISVKEFKEKIKANFFFRMGKSF
jgi:guanylate kinase